MAGDGAALLAAAIRAACIAKAPRRTLQSVASAVAGVVFDQVAGTTVVTGSVRVAGAPCTPIVGDEGASPEVLLESLRSARRAQRRKKKEKRRAAKRRSFLESKPGGALETGSLLCVVGAVEKQEEGKEGKEVPQPTVAVSSGFRAGEGVRIIPPSVSASVDICVDDKKEEARVAALMKEVLAELDAEANS